jgi:hypothetical protein
MPSGRLLINGRWREAADGVTMPTFDPTTEEKITEVAKATPDDADEAVKAASEAFESGTWARMHHEVRAKILFRMADLLDERPDEFAIREAMDMGMPYRDFRETIVPHCSGLFRFFGGLAMQMNGGYRQSYEPAIRILTRREPLGVVACITPFNFPLVLTCSKVAPALVAGNTVVHKPASDTPLTALMGPIGRLRMSTPRFANKFPLNGHSCAPFEPPGAELQRTRSTGDREALRGARPRTHCPGGQGCARYPCNWRAHLRRCSAIHLERIRDVGHTLVMEKPAEFNRIVEDFLRD